MNVLEGLGPERCFKYFEEISHIPRGSGNVDGISNYLVEFAKERKLKYIQDEYKNVIIFKDGVQCDKNADTVIIQGHIDMVAVKSADCKKDMKTEGLDLYIDGDYIKAKGTTLGADDGIAVAYALAILDSDDIKHPPIEAVFTVDEEIGMLGAAAMDTSPLSGKIFLNIDSEDDGIFFAGCAGGASFEAEASYKEAEVTGNVAHIKISGLTGGHSGMEIRNLRGNANILAARILTGLSECGHSFSLVSFNGGEKDNAIACFADVKIILDDKYNQKKLIEDFKEITRGFDKEIAITDPNRNFDITVKNESVTMPPKEIGDKIISFLTLCNDGILRMSPDYEGLVETSSNCGIVSTENGKIKIIILLRSSVDASKQYHLSRLGVLARELGLTHKITGEYMAWEYDRESHIRDIITREYEAVCKNKAKVEVIHAGLECGIFKAKMPELDCVSFGPQADDIHTYNEKMSISSFANYWIILKNTLAKLA